MILALLTSIVAWWWEQIRSLAPQYRRAERAPARHAVVAFARADSLIELVARRGRRVSAMGVVDMSAQPAASKRRRTCLLHAEQASLLQRDVSMPVAAECDLDDVLGHELERLTPFSSRELVWSWRVLTRSQGRLTIRLSMIPVASLRAAMNALAASGWHVNGIEVGGACDTPGHAAMILPIPLAPRDGIWQSKMLRAGWAACAMLIATGLALPLLRQSDALRDVAVREASLQPDVTASQALRRDLAAATRGFDVVAVQDARSGDPLQGLAALTAILPDNTYLTSLTLNQRKLVVEGRSAAAVRLIASLSSGPVIGDASFAAPLTRDEASGVDLFSIDAELKAPSP